MMNMMLWSIEAPMLLTSRFYLGDKATGDILFNQDYNPDFVGRHTHQLAGMWEAQWKE